MPHGVTLEFNFVSREGSVRKAVKIDQAVVGGWTARDKAAMEHHIHELEAIGVPRPSTTPLFYRVSARRLTTGATIEALGDQSSGEVEYILVKTGGRLWVGAASDHTDRKVEVYSIPVAKQMCEKPVADTLWPYEEVAAHWDSLKIRSYIIEGGARILYQEGTLAALLPASELLQRHGELADGTLMFGGTVGAKGGVRASSRFEMELIDDKLGRQISHAYNVMVLPVVG